MSRQHLYEEDHSIDDNKIENKSNDQENEVKEEDQYCYIDKSFRFHLQNPTKKKIKEDKKSQKESKIPSDPLKNHHKKSPKPRLKSSYHFSKIN